MQTSTKPAGLPKTPLPKPPGRYYIQHGSTRRFRPARHHHRVPGGRARLWQARAEVARVSFEQDLTEQLAVLTRALTFSELDQDQALAAFDQAAGRGGKASTRTSRARPPLGGRGFSTNPPAMARNRRAGGS